MKLLENISLKSKLAIIIVSLLTPIFVLGYLLISEKTIAIEFAQKEIHGVSYMRPVRSVLQHVTEHRGMVNAYLNGDTSFHDQIIAERSAIAEDIKAVDAMENQHGTLLDSSAEWRAIKTDWQNLAGSSLNAEAKDSFVRHTALAEKIIGLIARVGDTSNLILDPDLDSYYLMDLVVLKLPTLLEELGLLRGTVSGLAASATMSDDDKIRVAMMAGNLRLMVAGVERSGNVAFENNATLEPRLGRHIDDLTAVTNQFLQLVEQQVVRASFIDVSAQEVFESGTRSIDLDLRLYDETSPILVELLELRIATLNTKKYMALTAVGINLLLSILLTGLTIRSITTPLQQLGEAANAMASGNLNGTIKRLNSKDEMGWLMHSLKTLQKNLDARVKDIARVMRAMSQGNLREKITDDYEGDFSQVKEDVNATLDKLSDAIGQIKNTADSVAEGASEISQGNTALQGRTEEQASNLEETAATMQSMTDNVNQNAKNAVQASQLADEARQHAEKGGEVVGAAIAAMAEINRSSRKISDITGVIDEIAFQTNLLALNASVEAARAGEHGRGFAVVASEVRNLAQRSAQSAKQIKDLIEDSVGKVEDGSRLVDESGITLNDIVGGVTQVSEIIAEIAEASQEQSSGIVQVNKAVNEMDDMTQQNSAMVEQTNAASETLNDLARRLSQLVAFFNFDHGFGLTMDRRSSQRPWTGPASMEVVSEIEHPAPKQAAAGGGVEQWDSF